MTSVDSGTDETPVPASPTEPGGCLIAPVTMVCDWSHKISLAKVFRWEQSEVALPIYVFVWSIVLLGLLFIPRWSILPWLATIIAVYRLQDFFFATLFDLLRLDPARFPSDWRAPFLLNLYDVAEAVLVFAIVYRACFPLPAQVFDLKGSFSAPLDYLYLSWACLPPLGTPFAPLTIGARLLTVLESGIAFLLIGMVLQASLSNRS